MALEILNSVSEADGCKSWDFVDTTGAYNDPDNLTGYGAPNTASSAVTGATIYILPYGYTTGWLFTFTILTNEITACTVTSPAGVVTNIFSDLESVVFPFTTADPFVIIGEWLGFGEDSELTSSVYNFEYKITGAAFEHVTDTDEVITCQVCCCVRNAEANLDATDCECQDEKVDKAARADIWLQSAAWAMEDGDRDRAYANLMYAKELCEGKCANC